MPVARKEWQETHINPLEVETFWKACQQFREEIKGKVSFQINNTTALSYLQKEGSIHCRKINALARKNLA